MTVINMIVENQPSVVTMTKTLLRTLVAHRKIKSKCFCAGIR